MQNVYCYTLLHCPLYTRNYCSCTSKQTCSCSHSVYEPVNTLPGKCNRLIFVHKPPFTLKHNFTQTNSKGSQTNLHKQLMKNGSRISVFSNARNFVFFTIRELDISLRWNRRHQISLSGWIQLLHMRAEAWLVREWQAIPGNSKFWRNFWKICLWLERKLQMWGKLWTHFYPINTEIHTFPASSYTLASQE